MKPWINWASRSSRFRTILNKGTMSRQLVNMNKTDAQVTDEANNKVNIADPFAKRLMVRYLSRREADLKTLRSALADEDFESIRKKGHNLFGSGSAYGLDRISELGADLEKAAKKRDSLRIGQLVDTLEAFICKVRVV